MSQTEVAGIAGVVSVACGAYHTLALDKHGDVYSCGWGEFGQLGYRPTTRTLRRTMLCRRGQPPVCRVTIATPPLLRACSRRAVPNAVQASGASWQGHSHRFWVRSLHRRPGRRPHVCVGVRGAGPARVRPRREFVHATRDRGVERAVLCQRGAWPRPLDLHHIQAHAPTAVRHSSQREGTCGCVQHDNA